MRNIIKYISFVFLLVPLVTFSQSFKATATGSEVKVEGTSSLHDWEELAKEFSVTGQWADNQIIHLDVKVKAASLESGKSIMDDKTHEALKADKHPWITLKAAALSNQNNQITGTATLTIAGKQRDVPIKADYKPDTSVVTGAITLLMSDFGIDPPTAMFGTLLTGDQVTISYTFNLTTNKIQ